MCIFLALVLVFLNFNGSLTTKVEDPADIIRNYGYPMEKHNVQTEDGYFLRIDRIPRGRNNSFANYKPVLLNHGIGGSSGTYTILGPRRSLAFLLADNGYDVWMMNARGTTFSNKHVSIDERRDKKDFYNFSWHEIGMYDIPATIDYVLNVTNYKKLHYIGHSQGCTSFLVLVSSKPEYNEKLNIAVLLAPAVFMRNVDPLLVFLAGHRKMIAYILDRLNIYDLPNIENLRNILQQVCSFDMFSYTICSFLFDATGGYSDRRQISPKLLKTLYRISPSNFAMKQILHYFQLVSSGDFRQYDYGTARNLQIYGSEDPPKYDLQKISVPIAFFVGKNDRFSSPPDVKFLASNIKNVAYFKEIPWDYWNHVDFLYAKDALKFLYQEVLNIMALY